MNTRLTSRIMAAILVALLTCTIAASAAGKIPVGTAVTIRLNQSIGSEKAQVGDVFDGTLASDVTVNGKVVAKAGAPVKGKVTNAKDSGRLHVPGELTLRLTSIDGTAVSTSAVYRKGKSHTKSNVTKIGGSTAVGMLIGGLAGGGKGVAIGAAAGAAGGTALAAATGKQNVTISAESALSFTVQ